MANNYNFNLSDTGIAPQAKESIHCFYLTPGVDQIAFTIAMS